MFPLFFLSCKLTYRTSKKSKSHLICEISEGLIKQSFKEVMEHLENDRFFCNCDTCLHALHFGVEKLHDLK